ncbi:hypothetical protein GE061_015476 [Apolygus lucorum]|uniref:Osiris 2 n=1 Tax=Apolygus lucorum TaxID=248454 RepID=A0A8S9XL67_APOLU|nr:hypothetical protein GE061_015476 [Apolygus lucorum]
MAVNTSPASVAFHEEKDLSSVLYRRGVKTHQPAVTSPVLPHTPISCPYTSSTFTEGKQFLNSTLPRNLVTNEIDEDWHQDPFIDEAQQQCMAGEIGGCLRSEAATFLGGIFRRDDFNISEEARFVRTPEVSSNPVKMEGLDFSEAPRSGETAWEAAFGFVKRRAEAFLKTTALEVELTPELTEGGKYQPRFIDEIFSEVDALDDKNDKPNRRYEVKKLFIPLLLILKIFKVKLLVLLPIIFGLVSFKKVLAFLAIMVPGVIGYFKICKPDVGQSYGNFGHSSYYHRPPSLRKNGVQDYYYQPSYREQLEANRIAYNGYQGNYGNQ